MEQKIVHKFFPADRTVQRSAAEKENRIYRDQWVTTERIDRAGDIVRAKGMNADDWKENPVVAFAHLRAFSEFPPIPIGRGMRLKKKRHKNSQMGITADFQFPKEGVSEHVDEIYRLFEAEFLNAYSIGFRALEARAIDEDGNPINNDEGSYFHFGPVEFLKWELLEFSIVAIGMNADAVRSAVGKSANWEVRCDQKAPQKFAVLCPKKEADLSWVNSPDAYMKSALSALEPEEEEILTKYFVPEMPDIPVEEVKATDIAATPELLTDAVVDIEKAITADPPAPKPKQAELSLEGCPECGQTVLYSDKFYDHSTENGARCSPQPLTKLVGPKLKTILRSLKDVASNTADREELLKSKTIQLNATNLIEQLDTRIKLLEDKVDTVSETEYKVLENSFNEFSRIFDDVADRFSVSAECKASPEIELPDELFEILNKVAQEIVSRDTSR